MSLNTLSNSYDVAIIGAGLAGVTLARHLLLVTDKRVLLLDRRAEVPPARQKVGESSVQVGAYYYSKVLDLEEHLLSEHYMKYNLRFYWRTEQGLDAFEHFSQSYIRNLSNIACYQIDRNKLEAHILRENQKSERFTFLAPTSDLEVGLSSGSRHRLRFRYGQEALDVDAEWVVDTSGRSKFLAKRTGLARRNPIHHGTAFMWVEGLVNIDKLTRLTPREIRLKPQRRSTGHLPVWLATNHFMGEGFWFWVIPLQGKTSLGLVYDNRLIAHERVWTAEKLLEWIYSEFPLFEPDLRQRRILDYGTIRDYSHDCLQTISEHRWALSGEAGRFTDPLYSPGSDLISLHNTLIVDSILTADPNELALKTQRYEQLMQAFYAATVPSYAVTYDCLGDQEAFAMKYAWELSIYFGFYVFPFVNEFFTDRQFIPGFLSRFTRLGLVNHKLQEFISGFYQWKIRNEQPQKKPEFFDFTAFETLRHAEKMFYEVGVSAPQALDLLNKHLRNLDEMSRFLVAWITSRVVGDEAVLFNSSYIEAIDFRSLSFDPVELERAWAAHAGNGRLHTWSFDPYVLSVFQPAAAKAPASVAAALP